MVPLKYIALVLVALVVFFLYETWHTAPHTPTHRRFANLSFWTTLAAVVTIELMVRQNGGATLSWQFGIHLAFAIPFMLILGLLRFRLTGLRNKVSHRKWAYGCFALAFVMLITGVPILWNY